MSKSGTSKTKQIELAEQWQEVIDLMRSDLFGDALPENLVILPGRLNVGYGSFTPNEWVTPNGAIHVIHANKDYFNRPTDFWIGWIVHNAVHAIQFNQFNSLPAQGYHDKFFADVMETIGLVPSDDPEKPGKKTGKVIKAHFPMSGSKFDKMVKVNSSMLDLKIKSFNEVNLDRGSRNDNKQTYYCTKCMKPAYGGRNRLLVCVDCNPGIKDFIERGFISPMTTVKPEK